MADSASTRSWRDDTDVPRARSRKRIRIERWIFTLLAVLVIGLLTWVLTRPSTRPQTYLVTLALTQYDTRSVPPMDFVRQDFADLQGLENGALQAVKITNIKDLHTNTKLKNFAVGDVLIVYISAHGVSEGNGAYLLGPDYVVNDGDTASGLSDRVAPEAVLQEVANFQSSLQPTKLVVFDTGRLASDPRMGMLVNEFPRLLEQEIAGAAYQDSDLWVLLSHAMFQTTNALYPQGRSVFGQSFVEAVRGDADAQSQDDGESEGNGDGEIGLDELYRYTANRCADWVGHDPGEGQTPLLFRGGQAAPVVRPDPRRLVTVIPAVEDTAAEDTAAEDTTENQAAGDASSDRNLDRNLERDPEEVSAPQSQSLSSSEPEGEDATASTRSGQTPSPGMAGDPTPSPTLSDASADNAQNPSGRAEPPPTNDATAAGPKPTTDGSASPAGRVALSDEPQSPHGFTELGPALHAAWTLRDQIQDPARRADSRGWAPVDFAPHLWRALNADLIGHERRYYGLHLESSSSAYRNSLREVNRIVDGLRHLEKAITQGDVRSGERSQRIEDRLVEAWNQFTEGTGKTRWEQAPRELDAVIRAKRYYADLTFVAPYYVAWHDRASLRSRDGIPMRQDISKLLVDLREFGQILDDPNLAAQENSLQRMEEMRQDIQKTRVGIHAGLDQRADDALKNLRDPINQRRIADLLSTPLLNAGRRHELLDNLFRQAASTRKRTYFRVLSQLGSASALNRGTEWQWQQLRERIALHEKLLQLVPSGRPKLNRGFEDAAALRRPSLTEDANAYETVRSLGEQMKQFYAAMPSTIGDHFGRNHTTAALHLARLIDGRDALAASLAPRQLPDPLPAWDVPLRIWWATTPDAILRLDLVEPQLTTVGMVSNGGGKTEISTELNYDARLLRVRVNGTERRPRIAFPTNVDSNRRVVLNLEVTAILDRESARIKETELTLRTAEVDAHSPEPMQIGCLLPYPNRVELVVQRQTVGPDSPAKTYRRGDQGAQLRPFPNRKSPFGFELVNRFDRPKQVRLELLAVGRPADANWPKGRLFNSAGALHPLLKQELLREGRLEPGLRPLAEATVDLAADTSSPVRLSKYGSAASPPKSDEASASRDAPPGAAPAKSQEPTRMDVTDGLVCVVSELPSDAPVPTPDGEVAAPAEPVAPEKGKQWIFWLELEPLQPPDYFDAQVEFNRDVQQIEVTLQPKDFSGDGRRDLIVPGLDQNPVTIRWENPPQVATGPRKFSHTLSGKPGEPREASLYAPVDPNTSEYQLHVTVDNYPRAFLFHVNCDTGAVQEVMKDLNEVKIESLQSHGFSSIYVRGEASVKNGPTDPMNPRTTYSLDDRPATFPAPANAPIEVQLRADARTEAFLDQQRAVDRSGQAEAIEVRFANGRTERLYRERNVKTQFAIEAKTGRMVLDTTVRDHVIELDTQGLQGTMAPLVANLIVHDSSSTDRKHDQIDVILDGDPPEIEKFYATKKTFDVGAPIRVIAEVKDPDHAPWGFSGIEKVELGVDMGEPNSQLEKTEVLAELPGAPKDSQLIWRRDITITEKQLSDLQKAQLANGKHVSVTLLARATDIAGRTSQIESTAILLAPAKPEAIADPNPTAPISGTLRLGRLLPLKATVTLEGDPIGTKQTKVGRSGKFSFEKIPPGKYKLTAKGIFQNRERTGTLEIQHKPPKQPAQDLTIPVK